MLSCLPCLQLWGNNLPVLVFLSDKECLRDLELLVLN